MPTIKLKNGKVILKDGNVSCTCCEGCCMYPASGLGDTYTEDDLPDDGGSGLLIWYENPPVDEFNSGGLQKIGSTYKLDADEDYFIKTDNGKWKFFDSDENVISIIGDCLQSESSVIEGPYGLSVVVSSLPGGAEGYILPRVSLCRFEGLDENSLPVVVNFNTISQRWELTLHGSTASKSNNFDQAFYGEYTIGTVDLQS
jgi:hypothetical protein